MLTIFKTFHLVTSNDGILLVSTENTDHPFIIANNKLMGFIVFHAGDANFEIRYKVENEELLDMNRMKTYMADIGDSSHWVVSIPYEGKEVDPSSLYAFTRIYLMSDYFQHNFPENFRQYNNLAVITGIPE